MQLARHQQHWTSLQLALSPVNDRKPQQLASSAHVQAMAETHCEPWAPLAGDHELVPGNALDSLACSAEDTGVSNTGYPCCGKLGCVGCAGQRLLRCTVSTRQDMQVLAIQDVRSSLA